MALLVADMAKKGWLPSDLAREAKVSKMSVTRFLSGETQTERMAGNLAEALGYKPARYIVRVEAVAS